MISSDDDPSAAIKNVTDLYPFKITPFIQTVIEKDGSGALKRQFHPCLDELKDEKGHEDPIGDGKHAKLPGVIHRYQDRVLLLVSNECFTNCRFCFRKNMLSATTSFTADFTRAVSYIKKHTNIWEVIFSGGDPLTLTNDILGKRLSAVETIDHVKVIRIHTRAPVVNPARIDDQLVGVLQCCQKPVYLLLHVNHPGELAPEVLETCSRLHQAGIVLLSQTVLLRGINDSVETLSNLMKRLVENHIKPYYLHNCDQAKGTAHFRVDLETGRNIVSELRRSISGLCQPTFIVDIPHGYGKVPAGQERVHNHNNCWEAVDAQGKRHRL